MFSSAGRRGFPAAAQQEADFNSLKLGNGIRARLRGIDQVMLRAPAAWCRGLPGCAGPLAR